MKAKWFLENYDDEVILPMRDEIKKQGMDVSVTNLSFNGDFKGQEYRQFLDTDCVIFYGTLLTGKIIQRVKGWIPGVYCNFQNLCCSTYFSHWGKYLLNNHYIMFPLKEIERKSDFIFSEFGINGDIFIRPDSGAKTFTGQIINRRNLERDMFSFAEFASKSIDQIIAIISSPKKITDEWRVVVVNKEIMAFSKYKTNGEIDTKREIEEGALILAEKIALENWQPDRVYTLDICKSNGQYFLLEANSFSCCGLYECDLQKVIEKVSIEAVKEWEEYHEKI